MEAYKEIEGDLIKLAKEANFDVIAHGCNCFSTMGAGIAPQMAKAFGADKFPMELAGKGLNKLGCIDYKEVIVDQEDSTGTLKVVNAYTQYSYGRNHLDGIDRPLDYEALTLCMRKMNYTFKGQTIGLPQIGCGLAGGDWEVVREIIKKELRDCNIIVVIYKP